ncbi:hypothetical protein B0H16DRAFT_1731031 [Mycena metata]|uniref:Uncharacterized protein n=1 Tax=Mycena metata TaxID=1033252 RepID=A0AAD7I750_9AGAR|nr:hypothetical protein B0H16DRAFT_1731031 [Mycena metata]
MSPSDWEKATYYHGVSVDHPELLNRSDYLDTPFPHPTPLNAVWHTKIRDMLKTNSVREAVVEWIEGAVEKLSGPPLMRVTPNINPTYCAHRFLTPGLGNPVVTAEEDG